MPEDEGLIVLRRRFNKHLDEYRAHILDHEHKEMQLILSQERTARNIEELTKLLELQIKATRGPVEAWNTLSFIQRLVVWSTPFLTVAGILAAWYAGWLDK